jgi:hypothetical protein
MRAKGSGLDRDPNSELKANDWQELWNWAHPNAIEAFVEIYQDEGDESEGVEDEEEGADEQMEKNKPLEQKIVVPPMKLNDLMKFASVGITAPTRPGG